MIKGTYKQMLEAYLYSFVYTSNPTYVSVCGKGMNFVCLLIQIEFVWSVSFERRHDGLCLCELRK